MACSGTSWTSSCRICEERGRCRTTNHHSKIHPTIWPLPNAKIKILREPRLRSAEVGKEKSHFCAAFDAARFASRVYLIVRPLVRSYRRLKFRRGLTSVKCGIRRFRAMPTSGCGASRGAGHRPPQSSTTSHPERHTQGGFAALGRTSRNRPARPKRALLALLKFVAGWSAERRPI